MDEIIRRAKIFEGYSEQPYKCTADKWTIGYGYNFEDRGFRTAILVKILSVGGFSREIAESLLRKMSWQVSAFWRRSTLSIKI